MDDPRVDVFQLLKRDPQAWTALLAAEESLQDVVTAVTAQPVARLGAPWSEASRVTRYVVGLANHSDPISFIGKQTSAAEARFYQELAHALPTLAPRCLLAHVLHDRGWVILDDVPNHVPPHRWSDRDVEEVVLGLAELHATYWNDADLLESGSWLPHVVDRNPRAYAWETLSEEQSAYLEEGPAALISEHTLRHAGRLGPQFMEAANGVAVLRALGGWPGVLGESHLAAAMDLLDDPVPMLEPLLRLPYTLVHGNPNPYHWHLTLFEENRLIDWRNTMAGPGIVDLIAFQEQFGLLFTQEDPPSAYMQPEMPATEETIVDSYMLAMAASLGREFDARAMRLALPAARCLHVLLTWFPWFATWFDRMPGKYTWQRVNRLPDADIIGRSIHPMIAYRPFLAGVFERFLQSSRRL